MDQRAPAPNKERLALIDALRGIAALSVVLYHFVGFLPLLAIPVGAVSDTIVAVTRFGHLGVEVFFVLSGYVIAMTAARYSFSPGVGVRFIVRRLVRIVPPYWVAVAILVAGKATGYFQNTTMTPAQVGAHFVYAQDVLGYPPLDEAYWTLCLEVQFYLVFAVSMVALRRFNTAGQVYWFAALTLGSMAIDAADLVPREWFPRLWHQFGAGVLAYHARQERFARWPLTLVLIALTGLGVYRGRDSDFAVAAVAGLLLLIGRESRLSRACPTILVKLGMISYSLYLIHGHVGKVLAVVFRRSWAHTETTAWIAIAGGTVAALVFATAFYYWCERRAIEWSRRVRVTPE